VVSVKFAPTSETPSDAANAAALVPAVPAFVGPMPPSHAFTIWTGPSANQSARRINQNVALAALIESRTSGGKAGTPEPQASAVPPVPTVEHPEDAPPNPSPEAAPLPLLDLEPLSVPGEDSNR
jgi:hypothetical protein